MPKSRFKRVNEGNEAHNGSRDPCQDRGWTVETVGRRVGACGGPVSRRKFLKASNNYKHMLKP